MSETYILVNESKEQYVEPDTFLPKYDANENVATYTGDAFELVAAVNFIDWATGKSAWVIPYLIADTSGTRINDTCGDLFGTWHADAIRLVGGLTGEHDEIKQDYTNISRELYEEVKETNTDLPPATIQL